MIFLSWGRRKKGYPLHLVLAEASLRVLEGGIAPSTMGSVALRGHHAGKDVDKSSPGAAHPLPR